MARRKPHGSDFTPNAEQAEALRQYRERHGRTWKAKLQAAWMRSAAPGLLQQCRNQGGPRWLHTFDLDAWVDTETKRVEAAVPPTAWRYGVHMTQDGPASFNACVYATQEEADAAGRELLGRWLLPVRYSVHQISEPVNYRFNFDSNRPESLRVAS